MLAAAGRQGVVLDCEEVRARFHVHFQSDRVHAEEGVFSTDEATERRRWQMIVTGVLPEVAEPDRAFDELWDHFGRPDSWRCYPDVVPVLDSLAEQGISVCVGSNFDGRLEGRGEWSSRAEGSRRSRWLFRRKWVSESHIRRFFVPRVLSLDCCRASIMCGG